MSPQPDLTGILEELASGRIDAAEAARRIDTLKAAEAVQPPHTAAGESGHDAGPEPSKAEPGNVEPESAEPSNEDLAQEAQDNRRSDEDAWASSTDRPQHTSFTRESFRTEPTSREKSRQRPINTGGVERITVRAVGRRVRIIGETSVATLAADGPHVLRRNGAVLEVSSDGDVGSSVDGFSILRAPRSLDDFRSLGLGKELFLRVNPNITVDVEVTAGSLNTERVPHLGKIRVTAGGAKLLDVQELNDVSGAGRPGHHQGRNQDGTVPDPGRIRFPEHRAGRRLQRDGEERGAAREGQLDRRARRARRRGRHGQRQRAAGRRGRDGVRPDPGGLGSDGARGGLRVSERTRRPVDRDHHEHRAPSDCPVCGDHLAVTRLGCGSCGSELAGVFAACPYCSLDDADAAMLPGLPALSRATCERWRSTSACPIRPPGSASASCWTGSVSADEPEPPPLNREQILSEVAAGALTPAEAQRLLGS